MPTGKPSVLNAKIGRELRAMRVRAGLNQQDVVNMSEGKLRIGTVIAIENSKYNAGISQVLDYADILGYEVTFIPKALPTDR